MDDRPVSVTLGWRLTRAVKWIILINVVVFLVEVITVNWLDQKGMIEHLAVVPVRTFYQLELWQPFTYLWLHSPRDPMHLVLNMLFLWMFGSPLEQAWGSRNLWTFYLVSGVGAGLAVAVVGIFFEPDVPTLGASGAIYGLVAAFGLRFPETRIFLLGIFPIKGKHFVLIPIGYAILDFLTRATGTSHVAHLGGLVIGALLVKGWWRPSRLVTSVRHALLKRRLKSLRPLDDERPPYLH